MYSGYEIASALLPEGKVFFIVVDRSGAQEIVSVQHGSRSVSLPMVGYGPHSIIHMKLVQLTGTHRLHSGFLEGSLALGLRSHPAIFEIRTAEVIAKGHELLRDVARSSAIGWNCLLLGSF